jgi:hypothetical protein
LEEEDSCDAERPASFEVVADCSFVVVEEWSAVTPPVIMSPKKPTETPKLLVCDVEEPTVFEVALLELWPLDEPVVPDTCTCEFTV